MLILVSLFSSFAFAAGDYGGGGGNQGGQSYIGQTQSRRSQERFNILDFIRDQQKAVNSQNSKWGRGGSAGNGPFPDFNFSYFADSGDVTRDGSKIGKDTRSMGRVQFLLDSLFTAGNKTRLLNIDLGVEAFVGQTTKFEADPLPGQEKHAYTEMGGGILIRPIGRSSQDTGLILKGGYVNINETGLWSVSQGQVSIYGTYLGAEAKLYLLPFLGIRGEYMSVLETKSDVLQGKWKMQRFTYGGFLEVYLLNLGVHLISTEMVLTSESTGVAVEEVYSGVGFSGTLHF